MQTKSLSIKESSLKQLEKHINVLISWDKNKDDYPLVQEWIEELYMLATITGQKPYIEVAREWETSLIIEDEELLLSFIGAISKIGQANKDPKVA